MYMRGFNGNLKLAIADLRRPAVVLILIVRADVAAEVAATMRTHRVEHDADVFGLDLPQRIAHPAQHTTAVGTGAGDGDHTVHARGQGHRFRNEQQRAAVENHMIKFFHGPLSPLPETALALVVLAVAFSAVSLYYYLQVLKRAYVMAAVDETPIQAHPVTMAVLLLIAAAVVLLGCFPALLQGWIESFCPIS